MHSSLLLWFASNRRHFPWRKRNANLYQRVVSEILLQRTRAEVAASFLPQFTKRYPSWKKLALANEACLAEFLRPLGLFRRRAASLINLARVMAERNGRFPREKSEVMALPAVGQYVCNAVMLFSGRQAEPLLDVNMARVIERCFGPRKLVDIRYDPELQDISRLVIFGPRAIDLNWAILDLGALLCRKSRPHCSDCPLSRLCDFNLERSPDMRPAAGRRSVL
jgi:A/G-specific adenine glycosylase